MSISAIGSAVSQPISGPTPEKAEGPGPDHDHDSDDLGSSAAPIQAAPAPDTGLTVDKTA